MSSSFVTSHGIDEEVFDLLRQHSVGLCVFDMPDFACPAIATADFAYYRFHGSTSLYASCYSQDELAYWAEKISQLGRNLKSVYVYFDNNAMAYAVRNTETLARTLG